MVLNFLNIEKKCNHANVHALAQSAYCPDCGEFVQNKWYLCRCKCCSVKRKGMLKFNKVMPDTKFCTNCGCGEFYLEELDKIDFVNIHFAVLKKETLPHKKFNFASIQTWVVATCESNMQRALIGVSK